MQIKTLPNKIEKYKSFVYKEVHIEETKGKDILVVDITARLNSKPECSICGKRYATYDTRSYILYKYVPVWGIRVFIRYTPRRVNCPVDGIHVERVPWSRGNDRLTRSYKIFLACWAKRMVINLSNVYKSPYILRLGIYQNQNAPIDSDEEPTIKIRGLALVDFVDVFFEKAFIEN